MSAQKVRWHNLLGGAGSFVIKTSEAVGLIIERNAAPAASIRFKSNSGLIGELYVSHITGELMYDNALNGKSYKINMTQTT